MADTSDAKQRLLELHVGEVSLVDHPANEEEWVVTKRKEPNTVEDVKKAQLDPHTATFVTMNAIRDSLYNVTDKLRDPSKLGEAQAEIERIKTMLDSATTLAAEITKAVNQTTTAFSEMVTKAKGEGKKMPPWMKEQMTKLAESVKAMVDEDGEDDAEKEVKAAKALDGAIEMVTKAGKAQFSKERSAKLADAFKNLGMMFKDADGDGFAKAISDWTGAAKADATAAKTGDGAAPAAKAEEAPAWFSSAIDNLAKTVKAVSDKQEVGSKRLDNVEKSEAVSKSLDQNKTDDVKVEKSEKSIWHGVI